MRIVLLFIGLLISAAATADTLYKFDPGPYEVKAADAIVLDDPMQQRKVTFRLLAPDNKGTFPVAVFSHGGFCAPEMYDRITRHWVSHGYIVVAPNHIDSPNNAERPGPEQMPFLPRSRLRDVSLALDELDQIIALSELDTAALEGRYAVSGHSFGAAIAMMKSGLKIKPDQLEAWGDGYDPRFIAGVFFSAPGNSDEMVAGAFSGLTSPFMATGGSNDVGRIDTGEVSAADWRRQVFTEAPPGDKYSVIVDKADHYLGGLICNPERGGEPDPEAVGIVRSMTLAFLDAYLREDPSAKEFLLETDIAQLTKERADFRFK